ncbi:MAG: HlyD family efflux transporter periplasmic adaptor subunit [Gemmatimonadota bacterium]
MSVLRRPTLAAGVRVVEQKLQGETAFVVKNPLTGGYLRFGEAEVRVMRQFDGQRTIGEIVAQLHATGMSIAEASVDSFATRLATMGLVERTFAEKTSAQLERLRQERRERRRPPLFRGELLRMRFPLSDPDAMLTRTMPWFRWCFTPAFVYGSLVIFLCFAILLVARWSELTASFSALMQPSALSIGTALLFWLTFIVVLTLHEFGHAYACKAFSGEVNEMGFMLVYFQPAFYCNVNDAWTFTDVRQRLWVTAAGAWVELLIGAAAALVWTVTAPGTLVNTIALMATITAGGMALVSNLNPLIPLDGYFALSDWLEIPNLRQRAFEYFNWYVSSLFRTPEQDEPVVTQRERRIFLTYGALAAVYIAGMYVFILNVVVGWIAGNFGWMSAALLVFVLALRQRQRLWSWFTTLRSAAGEVSRASRNARTWHVLRVLPAPLRGRWGVLLAVALCLLIPWPRGVSGQFTAFPAALTSVIAPSAGVITEVLVSAGEQVQAGLPVVTIGNPTANRSLEQQRLERDTLQLLERATQARGDRGATFVSAMAQAAAARTENLSAVRRAMTVRAAADGQVLTDAPHLLLGKAVQPGTLLLQLGRVDSLELRLQFHGAGAASLRDGDAVSLLVDADAGQATRATLTRVRAVAARVGGVGVTEAIVVLPATAEWRAGTRGHARVRLGMSTVGGSMLWALRSRMRPDLFL